MSELSIFVALMFLSISGPGFVVCVDTLTDSFKRKYAKEMWFRKIRSFYRITLWYIDDFLYTIRAKCILYWHLSWPGNKVDRCLIYYEVVKSFKMNRNILPYLNNREMEAYKNNCEERENYAYELYLF